MSRLLELGSQPLLVETDLTVREAALIMQRSHVGSLVIAREGEPIGLITDRDLALQSLTTVGGYESLTVGECCSAPLHSVPARSSPEQAARSMRLLGIRRLALRDEDESVVGVVSFDDLIQHFATQLMSLGVAVGREFQEERAPMARRTSVFGTE